MLEPSLPQALALVRDGEAHTVSVAGSYSNAAGAQTPDKGAPFGGLMAALAGRAMRHGLALEVPLRSLTVQFMAAARFDKPVAFTPRLSRGGRTVAYTTVEARQGERAILQAMATWGRDGEGPALAPLTAPPPPLDSLDPEARLRGPMAPHFSHHVEYRFDGGPNILGGNADRAMVERLWMRTRDGAPLDEDRLCFLLDALYPPAWTAFKRPPMMTSVDLRYDILSDPTPQTCPDGWAFFEYRMHDIGLGWTIDDCACWGVDGTPIALARQRRKLL